MGLRPSPANWFEIVVPKKDADDAMEVLAGNAEVQFEWTGEHGTPESLESLRLITARYRAFAREFGRYWPKAVFDSRCCELPLETAADMAQGRIEHWHAAAEPALERLAELQRQAHELKQWRPVLESLSGATLDLGAFARAGPALRGFCLLTSEEGAPPEIGDALWTSSRFDERKAYLGVLPGKQFQQFVDEASSRGDLCLPVPEWLDATPGECLASLTHRREDIEQQLKQSEDDLRQIAADLDLANPRGVLERIEWFLRTAEGIDCDSHYCWITGWIGEQDSEQLNQALRAVGIQSSIDFVEPPGDVSAPSVVHNPAWLKPFEVFTRAIGVPGVGEADPTTWVALLVPLMFGYMCGDVGHGGVIIAAGIWLRGRTGLWPLLVYCGISSTGFGFVYGDVFGFEQLIDPLWIRPLEQPLMLLTVPVFAGALVLTVGVLLHLIESCWSGQGRLQGVADAAQLLVYWGLMLAFLDLRFIWVAVAGVSLCMLNRLWVERSAQALLIGIGKQAESTFTLLLNTLSFARVGAFALAHAALESVIMIMADSVTSTLATVLVVVLGNAFVVVMEALVVSIQTTRLVLFEFFIHFFQGRGRGFQPTSAPSAAEGGKERRRQ